MLQYINIIMVLLDFCVLFAWSVWNRHIIGGHVCSFSYVYLFHVWNYSVDFDDSWCCECALNAVRQISFWSGLSTVLHNITPILHKHQILFHKFSILYRWQNTDLIKTSLCIFFCVLYVNEYEKHNWQGICMVSDWTERWIWYAKLQRVYLENEFVPSKFIFHWCCSWILRDMSHYFMSSKWTGS